MDTNLFPNKYPHFSSAYDITSKQVLVPKRGKKKYQRFLYPVHHLNQRKSPSAPLVSKEIETDFFRRRFSRRSRKVPEVADLSISCGWGVVKVGGVRKGICAVDSRKLTVQRRWEWGDGSSR